MSSGETDSSSPGSSPGTSGMNNLDKTFGGSTKLSFSIDSILDPHFGTPKSHFGPISITQTTSPAVSPPKFSFDGALSPSQVIPLTDPRSLYPAWVFCTRYSDRPSAAFSGTRCRRIRKRESPSEDEKRPRTAFTPQQLQKLKQQFVDNRYLTEKRRQELAHELGLNESQIKIWFQNKRAKLKKAQGEKPSLALHLMAQGLYNPSLAISQHCMQI